MSRKVREIETKLLNKYGFVAAKQHASDHKWLQLDLPRLSRILTKLSHGRGEVHAHLEGKMARQMGVPAPFFKTMLDCKKTKQEYYATVQANPVGVVRRV
jgi:hypothetical protein